MKDYEVEFVNKYINEYTTSNCKIELVYSSFDGYCYIYVTRWNVKLLIKVLRHEINYQLETKGIEKFSEWLLALTEKEIINNAAI